jgi:hypothetical protein
VIEDKQMVANPVERVRVEPQRPCVHVSHGSHFLIKDLVTEFLSAPRLGGRGGKPDFQIGQSPERMGRESRQPCISRQL